MKDIDKIVADVPARPSNADIDRAMSRRLFERRETLRMESSVLLGEAGVGRCSEDGGLPRAHGKGGARV